MAKSKFSITALIGVDSSLMSRGLGKATRKMGKWAKNAMATLNRIVLAGVGMASAALAGFAVKSVKEFTSFEQGMKEVFTLLPDITQQSMSQMENDVLNLADKMGVLPEEVVPSLYQALSAGVPPGNVFDFLTIAIKGAKAGVATTAESVDLLSSVVNAYGKDNISAAQASDIIFTTIKEGKTTFTELASAIYQVGPVAANAGVSFQDVGASIAALTAQGVPTKVATTQIRQAILAMMAPNKAMSGMFEHLGMNAMDLADIMAQPGGLKTAMQMVLDASQGNTLTLKEMMGSVEGLQALMAITANGGEKFAQTMVAMGNAAGATQAAYETMTTALKHQFNKVLASLKVVMIKMGKSLAPFVRAAVPAVTRIIKMIGEIPWTKIMQGFARVWLIGIKPYADAVIKMLKNLPWHLLIQYLVPIAKLVVGVIQNIGSAFIRLGPMIIPALQAYAGYISMIVLKFYLLTKALKKAAPDIAQVFRAIFQSLAAVFNFLIAPSKEKFKMLVEFIKTRFLHLGKSTGKFLKTIKDFLVNGFSKIFSGIGDGFSFLLRSLWANLKKFFSNFPEVEAAANWFFSVWNDLKNELGPLFAELMVAFQNFFGAFTQSTNQGAQSGDKFKQAIGFIAKALAVAIHALTAFLEITGAAVRALMHIGKAMLPLLKDYLPQLKPLLSLIIGLWKAWMVLQLVLGAAIMGLLVLLSKLIKLLSKLFQFLKPAIEYVKIWYSAIWDMTKTFWGKVWSLYKRYFVFMKDALRLFWEFFKQAAVDGVQWWKNAFAIILSTAKNAMAPIFALFDFLKKKVWDVLFGGTITKDFKKAFDFIGGIVSTVIGAIIAAFDRMKNIVGGIFGGIFKLAEKALGFASKIIKGTGGALGSIAGKLGFGGGAPAGAQVRGSGGTINTSTLQTSLRPIVEKLTSMDITLKSIDRKLSGKFVNQ